ncbi:hypothetical protein F4805DRAFT_458395 [Annulohypoxylon moriforme]|nr:hypothetical protein F4805DRAFT_458395 [Annulohypoxylon moriforme]
MNSTWNPTYGNSMGGMNLGNHITGGADLSYGALPATGYTNNGFGTPGFDNSVPSTSGFAGNAAGEGSFYPTGGLPVSNYPSPEIQERPTDPYPQLSPQVILLQQRDQMKEQKKQQQLQESILQLQQSQQPTPQPPQAQQPYLYSDPVPSSLHSPSLARQQQYYQQPTNDPTYVHPVQHHHHSPQGPQRGHAQLNHYQHSGSVQNSHTHGNIIRDVTEPGNVAVSEHTRERDGQKEEKQSEKKVTCPECKRELKDKTTLSRHKKTVHTGKKCKWANCPQGFDHEKKLFEHLKGHHQQAIAAGGDRLKCHWPAGCSRTFKSLPEVHRHIKMHNTTAAHRAHM